MEPIRPLGLQEPSVSVRAQVYPVRRFSTTTSGDGDTKKWTENTIHMAMTGAKKGRGRIRRRCLEKNEGGRERPIADCRWITAIRSRVHTRCRKTSRKLHVSEGGYFLDL